MVSRTSDWTDELGRWLKPFLDRLGHKARRQMCPLYVLGLIGPGERKSVDMLANAKWRTISWRTGTKGKLKARFAAVRVRVADGPPQRIRDKGQQHLPGDEAWLIGEHRMSGEKKYYLANLPAKTDLRTLATTIKARWICEQAHQQMKEELGLDHFEGRSWQGLHRHALMTMIAYAFPVEPNMVADTLGSHRKMP